MRAKKIISVALLLLLSFFFIVVSSVSAEDVIMKSKGDLGISAENGINGELGISADEGFGPGADIPLFDPPDPDMMWLFGSPPVSCTWVIQDATFHIIYRETHSITPLDSGDPTYPYAAQDKIIFTIPAFASEGSWYAHAEWTLNTGDGTIIIQPAAGWTWTVVSGGWFENIFIAPLYVLGYKLPALFWCAAIIWVPLIVMGVLFVYARSAEGIAMVLADARDAGRRAREAWRKKREQKQS